MTRTLRMNPEVLSRQLAIAMITLISFVSTASEAAYPVIRPAREKPAPDSGRYVIYPGQDQQVVWGLGFEIQSDSIASGNSSLPEARTSVPHDLTPSERKRFANEMLTGFRYCRLAGGLYWRGTDPEGKYLQPRWPEQLEEVRQMMEDGGVESLSFEYWSPAPFWKANGGYTRNDGEHNRLRCFGPDFANDPIYKGDVSQFLRDFAEAKVRDIQTLQDAGFRIDQWGLSNEPWVSQAYSSCVYTKEEYGQTFKAVAPAIRAHDPSIKIIADTMWGTPRYIAPVMKTEYAKYVDALVVHAIGDDSKQVPNNFKQTRALIKQKLPLFQNEYEYLQGPASRDRCHNTVQNIMNWFQLAESPTWYWIHALKPYKNAEASGYSLGFWMPVDEQYAKTHGAEDPGGTKAAGIRQSDRHQLTSVPEELIGTYAVAVNRGNGMKPGRGYQFRISNRSEVYLLVHDRGETDIPDSWEKTGLNTQWDSQYTDTVYRKVFEPGVVDIPPHNGKASNGWYGVPHTALVRDISGSPVVVQITDLPKNGKVGEVKHDNTEEIIGDLEPGHWTWNKYNWHSVVGFLRHMPWDSTVVKIKEDKLDHDMRILGYKRPDGKLVIVVSNRSWKDYTFQIDTRLKDANFVGYRYTPDETGDDFMGVELGELSGRQINLKVPDLAWEFWVQQ